MIAFTAGRTEFSVFNVLKTIELLIKFDFFKIEYYVTRERNHYGNKVAYLEYFTFANKIDYFQWYDLKEKKRVCMQNRVNRPYLLQTLTS